MKKYFDQIGEQETNKIYHDIEDSARTSLEKFFILRKLVELLGIENIDWNKHLDAEEKLYEKLSSGEAKAPVKKTTKTKKNDETADEKPKKAPAKKKKDE